MAVKKVSPYKYYVTPPIAIVLVICSSFSLCCVFAEPQ